MGERFFLSRFTNWRLPSALPRLVSTHRKQLRAQAAEDESIHLLQSVSAVACAARSASLLRRQFVNDVRNALGIGAGVTDGINRSHFAVLVDDYRPTQDRDLASEFRH